MTGIQIPPVDGVRVRDVHSGRRRGIEVGQISESENATGLDALIAAGLRIVDAEGVATAIAAERVIVARYPSLEPPILTVACRGLAAYIANVLGRLNRLPPAETPEQKDERAAFLGRFQLGTTHSRTRLNDVLLRVTLGGAEGTRKSLIDFTLADVQAFRSRADNERIGWEHRVAVMDEYETQLKTHAAKTGRELPQDAVERVRVLAKRAWA